MSSLKVKQKLFVDEYLVDLNATKAAIRAGYSEKTARQQGARLLTNVDIKAAVDEALAERSERTEIKGDAVIKSIASIGFSNIKNCVAVLYGDATIEDLTDEQAAAIDSATVETYLEVKGDEARAVKRVHIKFKPALPALIQLGKHSVFPASSGIRSSSSQSSSNPPICSLMRSRHINAEQILGRPPDWASVYDPTRKTPKNFNKGGESQSLVHSLDDIKAGEGGVMNLGQATKRRAIRVTVTLPALPLAA